MPCAAGRHVKGPPAPKPSDKYGPTGCRIAGQEQNTPPHVHVAAHEARANAFAEGFPSSRPACPICEAHTHTYDKPSPATRCSSACRTADGACRAEHGGRRQGQGRRHPRAQVCQNSCRWAKTWGRRPSTRVKALCSALRPARARAASWRPPTPPTRRMRPGGRLRRRCVCTSPRPRWRRI